MPTTDDGLPPADPAPRPYDPAAAAARLVGVGEAEEDPTDHAVWLTRPGRDDLLLNWALDRADADALRDEVRAVLADALVRAHAAGARGGATTAPSDGDPAEPAALRRRLAAAEVERDHYRAAYRRTLDGERGALDLAQRIADERDTILGERQATLLRALWAEHLAAGALAEGLAATARARALVDRLLVAGDQVARWLARISDVARGEGARDAYDRAEETRIWLGEEIDAVRASPDAVG